MNREYMEKFKAKNFVGRKVIYRELYCEPGSDVYVKNTYTITKQYPHGVLLERVNKHGYTIRQFLNYAQLMCMWVKMTRKEKQNNGSIG